MIDVGMCFVDVDDRRDPKAMRKCKRVFEAYGVYVGSGIQEVGNRGEDQRLYIYDEMPKANIYDQRTQGCLV